MSSPIITKMIQIQNLNPDLLSFNTLMEALNYQELCPVCQFKLDINDRDLATDIGYEFRGERKGPISFFLGVDENEVMTIDPLTGEAEVTCDERSRSRNTCYTIGTQGTILPKTKRSSIQYPDGMFGHSVTVDCKKCCQYGYVLQIYVDMGLRKVCGLYLNSEWITVEKNGTHEIKNNYAAQKTYYSCFDFSERKDQHAELPLVPLNVKNPTETVIRIRKLLVFS